MNKLIALSLSVFLFGCATLGNATYDYKPEYRATIIDDRGLGKYLVSEEFWNRATDYIVDYYCKGNVGEITFYYSLNSRKDWYGDKVEFIAWNGTDSTTKNMQVYAKSDSLGYDVCVDSFYADVLKLTSDFVNEIEEREAEERRKQREAEMDSEDGDSVNWTCAYLQARYMSQKSLANTYRARANSVSRAIPNWTYIYNRNISLYNQANSKKNTYRSRYYAQNCDEVSGDLY